MSESTTARLTSILESIREALEAAEHVLIVTHIDPDGDALGSQLACGRYLLDQGKQVTMVRDSEIPHKYRFLPMVDRIVTAESLPESAQFDAVLALECPSVARMGSAARFLPPARAVVSIDHHADSVSFGHINWVDMNASSVGEMLYEYFEYVGYELPREVAVFLYTAILTDTGRFRFQSTSPRTMAIAGELIRRGADPRSICDRIYFNQRREALRLLGMVLNSMEYYADGAVCALSLTRDMLARSGASEADSDGIVDYTLFAEGVRVGVLFKEVDDSRTKVSLRSQNRVDVAAIARTFGGGGHPNAAGCVVGHGLTEARRMVLDILTQAIRDER